VSGVLVTGATGFIGRGTLAPLLSAGLEVHAASSREPLTCGPAGVRWHRADLHEPGGAEALVAAAAPTHLLHLAWYAEPGAFWNSTQNVRWVEASLRLMRAFAAHGGRRVVFAGSCAEYAWSDRVRCNERDTPCEPATLYGASKHGLHLIAERFARQEGLSLAWGRVFFVFGPHEHPARLGGAVARALVAGQEALCSHGEQWRDFLFSEDLAEAFAALLRSPVEGAVNLASGRPVQVRELVQALATAAGRPDLVRLGARPTSPMEPAELLADASRLRDEVGWAPRATLEQRAADTIAWWEAEIRGGVRRPSPA
jgi:nucleoside-diphosphate-sugar epimerase